MYEVGVFIIPQIKIEYVVERRQRVCIEQEIDQEVVVTDVLHVESQLMLIVQNLYHLAQVVVAQHITKKNINLI